MCTGTYGARKRHIYKTMMLTLMWENMSIWALLRTSSRANLYQTRTNESASLTNPYFTGYSIPKPTENTVRTAKLNVQMSPNSIRNQLDFRCGPLIRDDPDSSDMDQNKESEKNTSQMLWTKMMNTNDINVLWTNHMNQHYEQTLWTNIMKKHYEKTLWKNIMKKHYE